MKDYKRIPRKLKKQIPKGYYCYKGLNMNWKTGIYKIYPCHFFKYKKNKEVFEYLDDMTKESINEITDLKEKEEILNEKEGFCVFLKCNIEDQCKSCNINKEWK